MDDTRLQDVLQNATSQAAKAGFLEGVLIGIRIGIDDYRARIIDEALSDKRYFPDKISTKDSKQLVKS